MRARFGRGPRAPWACARSQSAWDQLVNINFWLKGCRRVITVVTEVTIAVVAQAVCVFVVTRVEHCTHCLVNVLGVLHVVGDGIGGEGSGRCVFVVGGGAGGDSGGRCSGC